MTNISVCGYAVRTVEYAPHKNHWKCTLHIENDAADIVKVTAYSKYISQAFGRACETVARRTRDILEGQSEIIHEELKAPATDFDVSDFLVAELPIDDEQSTPHVHKKKKSKKQGGRHKGYNNRRR